MKRCLVLSAVAAACLLLPWRGATAQALYFSVSSGTPTWIDDNLTANWSFASGGPYNSTWWLSGSDAHFEGTSGSINVSGSIASVAGIFFDTDGYSLTPDPVLGGNITLGADGINAAPGVGATIGVPLTLGSPQTWTNNGNTLTISGSSINIGSNLLTIAGSGQTVINGNLGPGTGGLTVNAAGGTLALSGINTYSGTTTLTLGVLDLDSPTALGSGALALNGGTLDNLSGSAGTLSAKNVVTLGGNITFQGTNNLNLGAGTLNLPTSTVGINVASGVLGFGEIPGRNNGTGGLTKTGSGVLAFTGSMAMTIAGTTTITTGAIEYPESGNNALLDTQTTYLLNGGVLQFYDNGNQVEKPNLQLGKNKGQLSFSPTASGGFAARGTEPVEINLSANLTWSSTSTGFLANGQSLIFGSPTSNQLLEFGSNINLDGGQRTVYVNAGQTGSAAELLGTLSSSPSGGGLTKDGPGILEISNQQANTYTGPTNVVSGSLYLDTNNAVAAGNLITVSSGATLGGTGNLSAKAPTVTIDPGGTLQGGQSGSGSLTLPNATFTGSGSITVPVTLPSLYFDTATSVGLTVGALTTGGGAGGTVLNVSGTAYPTFQGTTPTTVHLIQYTTLGGSGYNFVPGNISISSPLGVGGVTVVNNSAQGYIDLSYYANYAIWTGATSNVLTDPNNFVRSDNGAPITFAPGDDLYFDDSAGAANSNITLSATYGGNGTVAARTLYFNNNSVNYTINGSGVYGGGPPPDLEYGEFNLPTMVIAGSGTVTLTGENSFGTIYLNAGTLSSPTLAFSKQSSYPLIMNGGTLQWTANASTESTAVGADSQFFDVTGLANGGVGCLEIANGVTATLDTQNNNVNFSNVFGAYPNGSLTSSAPSTGGVNKIGTGTLYFNTSTYYPSYTHELYTGGTTITQGVLAFSTGVLQGTGPITMNGGILQWDNSQGANSNDVSSQLVMVDGTLAVLDLNGNTVSFASSFGTNSSGNPSTAALDVVGPGFLTLQAPNVYTGGTIVSSGTLEAAMAAALPNYNVPGNVTVYGGAMLAVMTGGSAGWTGAQIDALHANATWTDNTATLGIDTTGGNFTYAGSITEGLALNKLGPNTLTLTGTNTYSGGTTVSGGTLSVPGPANLANYANAGAITMNAGTTLMLGTGPNGWSDASIGPLLLNNAASLNSAWTLGVDTTNGDLTSAISYPYAPVALLKTGSGTLALTGANAYTGGTMIAAGILQISADANLGGSTGALTLNGGALQIVGGSEFVTDRSTTLGTSGGTFDVEVSDPGGAVFLGIITGSGALTKIGSGQMELDGANTYQGGTTIAQGTLLITNTAGIGTGPLAFAGDGSGLLDVQTGLGVAVSGSVTLNANGTIQTDDVTASTFSGTISGDGALIKAGVGTLVLSGNANSFGGGTFVSEGELMLTDPGSIPDGSSLTVGNAADFSGVLPAGEAAPPAAAISPVPEPATLALVATGAVLLWMRRRKHRVGKWFRPAP